MRFFGELWCPNRWKKWTKIFHYSNHIQLQRSTTMLNVDNNEWRISQEKYASLSISTIFNFISFSFSSKRNRDFIHSGAYIFFLLFNENNFATFYFYCFVMTFRLFRVYGFFCKKRLSLDFLLFENKTFLVWQSDSDFRTLISFDNCLQFSL